MLSTKTQYVKIILIQGACLPLAFSVNIVNTWLTAMAGPFLRLWDFWLVGKKTKLAEIIATFPKRKSPDKSFAQLYVILFWKFSEGLDFVIKSNVMVYNAGMGFQCSDCNYTTQSMCDMGNHIKAMHVTTCGCLVCRKVCPTREVLRKHTG